MLKQHLKNKYMHEDNQQFKRPLVEHPSLGLKNECALTQYARDWDTLQAKVPKTIGKFTSPFNIIHSRNHVLLRCNQQYFKKWFPYWTFITIDALGNSGGLPLG